MKKKFLFFAIAFFSIAFSQEYKISFINYVLNGKTQAVDLEHKLEIDRSVSFSNEEEIQQYTKDLQQKCINQRIFDVVFVEYEILSSDSSENSDENSKYIGITITATDTKSLVIVPYFKYDSNEGFTIKGKLNDSNFLGKMNLLEAEAFFSMVKKTYDTEWKPKFGGAFKYDLPFYAGDFEFTWDNDHNLSYTINDTLPEWDAKTGISVKLSKQNFDFNASVHQQAVRDQEYIITNDDIYFKELASVDLPVKLESIANWGDILYTPGADLEWIWSTHKINPVNEELARQDILVSHKISGERIDWVGNFRKGFSFEIKQLAGWNFYDNTFVHGITGKFQGHINTKYVGFNMRAYGFGYMNKTEKIGSYLRGIADDQYFASSTGLSDVYACSTPAALIFNFDMPIKIFTTAFTDRTFMRYLNCEVQLSPFIDVALTHNRATNRTFDLKDGFYTAGLECIVFPKKWNNLQLRFSAGFDLSRTVFKKLVDTSWRQDVSVYELSLGIGLFY